jgi:uncharacterized membrane protein YdbT with pleckstrin-like domain
VVTDPETTTTHSWLGLADGEELLWQSHPRLIKTLPSFVLGYLLAAGGLVGATLETVLFAGLVPLGVLVAIRGLLSNRRTWYVVTTRGLYLKTGVLGLSVRSIEYDRVQNSQYRQSVTGTVFGHGTVEIEIDGDADLTFRAIYDPDEVQETIRAQVGTGSEQDTRTGKRTVPGTREQWLDVLEELRSIRRVLDSSR